MNIHVYGGTTKSPKGVGLCETCCWGRVTRGESLSDERAACYAHQPAIIPITKPVSECNEYLLKGTLQQPELEKTAWILKSDGHGHLKFVPPG